MIKETIFILILIIFSLIIGSIIKYLNDTVFEEGKIDLVNIIQIGKYLLMFCIFLYIAVLFFKLFDNIENKFRFYYFICGCITLVISVMYLFTFIMETINMTDTPDDNKTIDGWEWTQITALGGILSIIVGLVVLIIGVKKTIFDNVDFIKIIDGIPNSDIGAYFKNINMWLLIGLICGPFLICILIGGILSLNAATNIKNNDDYEKYKFALIVITGIAYFLICFSSEIIQNGKGDKIFNNKEWGKQTGQMVLIVGWRLITSWAYVPYKFIKEIILKFLHSCHSNKPYKEKYKFEL